ncbi:MAG TPA: copper transporter [Flavobacteriales bacterium]|nr:copper transporter [Flavobacteriales bacterium]
MKKKDEKKNVMKDFGLSTASLKNRTTVFVLLVIILILGISAYSSMPRESFPEIVFPQIFVGTPYPGNSPLDIEKLVTRPLEKEINSITGIDNMTSTSVQGYSTVFIEFDFSVTPEEALRKVKDKVDLAMSDPDWPTDLPSDPNVFEMNLSEMMPVMNINLSGDFSIDQLEDYAEYLEDEIEALPEVTEVDIRGVQKKEMKINVDLYAMEANELNFNDILSAINAENKTISAGDLLSNNFRRTVRVVGDYKNEDEILNTIVKNENFNIVYLRDIAEVKFEDKEKESYAREYTKSVVMVDVKKRAGENLINASDKINDILAEAKKEVFPPNLEISITNDQSDKTRSMVSELENSIIFGMLLVILVLLCFLGIRNALFVGIAIPLSMFIAFFVLNALGVTLNMMVLFSLILALGMLVDNGIVVVENIYRLMDEGMSRFDAAKYGVGEVAWPIIASTATTLAAFLPLAIWPGIMGEFMKYLPITLMIVLSSSLFVALVFNPVLTAIWMKVEEINTPVKKVIKISAFLIVAGTLVAFGINTTFGNLMIIAGLIGLLNKFILTPATLFFQSRFIPWLETFYANFLRFTFRGYNPIFFLIGINAFLVFSVVLLVVFMPKVIFFPINQPNYVNVFIEAPIGTDIELVNEITKELEEKVINYAKKYEVTEVVDGKEQTENYIVKSIIAQVGEGTSDPRQGPSMAPTPHKARITMSFTEYKYRRGVATSDVLEDIRQLMKGTTGVQVVVDKDAAGPPTGKPINIEIAGVDYEKLLAQANSIRDYINENSIPGIEELKLDVEMGKPEMPITIDRAKARRLNISTGQIGNTLRNSLFGLEASSFKSGEDDYPIMIRLQDKYRYDDDILLNQKVTFRDQTNGKIQQVPISSVATAERSSTFSAVKRKDLKRIITISSNVLEGYNANEVVAEIQELMKGYDLPEEYTFKFTGEQEKQAEEMSFLGGALLIAVFLIFLIIVAQFNSAATPFIIVASVVFSLIGVFMGLVTFQMDFVVIMTMIGIISLAGIVVNNAIVLIDFTNLVMDRKKVEMELGSKDKLPVTVLIESMIEGGKVRLRPVLLTAITTVLGLIPMATGMNINFFTLLSDYDPQIYFGGDNVMFWGPMSWTIIFGLTFATFLTLVIVPVMYYLSLRLKYKYILN